jgi:hypothetical protein
MNLKQRQLTSLDAAWPASARCTNVNTFGILPHPDWSGFGGSLGTRLPILLTSIALRYGKV